MINITKKEDIFQFKQQSQQIYQGRSDAAVEEILTSGDGQSIIDSCRSFRKRVYTPLKTLIMFTKQVLSPDKSCRHAVAGSIAEQAHQGEIGSSSNTGPYCKARHRLPEQAVYALVKGVGDATTTQTNNDWKWCGREVKLVDGTTCTMSDTPANQAIFPQHNNQAEGAGFPILRLVALMSLTSGTVLDYAMDAYKGKGTGEHALFRAISGGIKANDILLGDRYYPSFF